MNQSSVTEGTTKNLEGRKDMDSQKRRRQERTGLIYVLSERGSSERSLKWKTYSRRNWWDIF